MIAWLEQYSGYAVLAVFFTAFCGIAFWAYLPRNRHRLEKQRDIPFQDK